MTDGKKLRASTVTQEQIDEMRRIMGQLVKGMGDDETWESVFDGGKCVTQKVEGRYHAAISIDEDAIPLEGEDEPKSD